MSFSSPTHPSPSGARGSKAPVGGSNRLPSSRERRPALAALAVILILLGAAGSALIALRSGDRQDYVAVAANTTIQPGQQITAKMLARGDLAGKTGGLVKYSEWKSVEGKYATSYLYPGQYLSKDSVTRDRIPAGGALVGVTLEGGRAPAGGFAGGAIVQVIQVPAANQPGGTSSTLVTAARVIDVSGGISDKTTNANTTLNVTIEVPTAKAVGVASAAASKTLVLVQLSADTPTEVPIDGAR
ncbi:SAF domain-containing protein [Kribbella sp. CA-293567]|uniref:SAF domain-containing protein n=1 Tax=Kribbella sp. CA-293567 TaxID=3002436 RepID=UPI0022DE15CC|nr:SAF domain-containing protein [Kribbella sp. CA-293567]WBQ01808.1 hypothetical protein OX958_17575 [Kribbella sp. CA-293567]